MPQFTSLKALGPIFTLTIVAVTPAFAQDASAITKKLTSEYSLTKTTADLTDIVTAGSILVLQKDNLVLVPTSTNMSLGTNSYKDGKITPSAAAKTKSTLGKVGRFGSLIPGVGGVANAANTADSTSGAGPRTYVTGEKMWVTKIEVKNENKEDAVVFDLFTDAVNDVRYRGQLRVVLAKGATVDQASKLVGDVFKIQPPEDQKADNGGGQQQQQQQQQAAPPAAQPAAPPPAIAPPPPPADTAAPPPDIPPPADAAPPATIALKQTIEQVVAIMGQPTRIANLGTKQIYYYKDLKVTFTAGKVTDVQ